MSVYMYVEIQEEIGSDLKEKSKEANTSVQKKSAKRKFWLCSSIRHLALAGARVSLD